MRRLIPAGLVLALITALLFTVGASSEPVDGIRVPTVEQLNALDARVTQLENRPTPTATATATVTATPTSSPTPTQTTAPPPPEPAKKIIGMSAPAADWTQRVTEVGTQGLTARRIFADLADGPQDQANLIRSAVDAGMMPVVSYKVGGDINGAIAGTYDTRAEQAADFLTSLDVPVAVTIWHEPRGDISGSQFVQLQTRLVPFFDGIGQLKVGPIMNGFLLTQRNQPAGINEFASFTTPALLDAWDFFGIDTYQPGTQTSPGDLLPEERIYVLEDWLDSQGKPDMPIGVGEYNGFSATAIAGVGETLLSMPEVWFGCVWNSAAARAGTLTGTRLDAYRATKADPRAAR